MFPYPLIVADIGGTNARFALARRPDVPLEPTIRLPVAAFPSFEDASEHMMTAAGVRARSMLVCAAGPVAGSSIQLTNSAWRLVGREIRTRLGLEQGLLLNDFEALALSLPSLPRNSWRPIGSGHEERGGPCVIAGPGTGLGVAALIRSNTPIASEGGHMSLGPWDEESARVLNLMRDRYGRVSAESLISGPGLVRLHRARAEVFGHSVSDKDSFDAACIVERGIQQPFGEDAATLKMFWDAVAAFAGDLALCFAATGGIKLAGGILPRMTPLLNEDRFRRVFEDKAPMNSLLRSVSTELLCDDDAVLKGMRAIADAPENFLLDYNLRCWSPPT